MVISLVQLFGFGFQSIYSGVIENEEVINLFSFGWGLVIVVIAYVILCFLVAGDEVKRQEEEEREWEEYKKELSRKYETKGGDAD